MALTGTVPGEAFDVLDLCLTKARAASKKAQASSLNPFRSQRLCVTPALLGWCNVKKL